MTEFRGNWRGWIVLAAAVAVIKPAAAQEPDVTPTPDPGLVDTVPADPGASTTFPEPLDTAPPWTWERSVSNRGGTVVNTHRMRGSEDGTQLWREHAVTGPRGEMVQTRERSQTEEGYLYRRWQTFNAPDGTPLRQHQWSLSGTDPYNYTREHQMTLPDGRTMVHSRSRSWDGTSGTMERSFTGPNGQTREFQRAWTPEDFTPTDPAADTTDATQAEPSSPMITPPVAGSPGDTPASSPSTKWGWLEKLNPFRNTGSPRWQAGPSGPSRSGFTVGSASRTKMRPMPHGLGKGRTGRPDPIKRQLNWARRPDFLPPAHGVAKPPRSQVNRTNSR